MTTLATVDYTRRVLKADTYASCPDCDGPLVKLSESTPDRWLALMVCRCQLCGRKWQLKAAIVPMPITEGATPHSSCGTAYGYRRHRAAGEPACDDCRDASADAKSRAGFRRRGKVAV